MDKKRLLESVRLFIEGVAMACMLFAVAFLLYRYIQYGEGNARQSSNQNFESEETSAREGQTEEGEQAEATAKNTEEKRQNEAAKETGEENIRVQLLTTDYTDDVHEQVEITSSGSFLVTDVVSAQKKTKQDVYRAGESFIAESGTVEPGKILCIESESGDALEVSSISRGDGSPAYLGKLYLYSRKEGFALINELPLEQYLYSVVSSEIPSYYPLQAQKAQAVCARTYALNCMKSKEKQNRLADLDDSVNFQVYNNYNSTEISREAVDSTRGEILELDEVLYFSTSCQSEQRSDLDSDEAFAKFLSEEPEAGAEYDSLWLRWEVVLSEEQVIENVDRTQGITLSSIDDMRVALRSGNGQAQQLEITEGENTYTIEGEYQIRQALSPIQAGITLMDGSGVEKMQLLPSAFFVFEEAEDLSEKNDNNEYTIAGGGYGHGIGMSQCGAAAMAEAGKDYREILHYYYYGAEPEEKLE